MQLFLLHRCAYIVVVRHAVKVDNKYSLHFFIRRFTKLFSVKLKRVEVVLCIQVTMRMTDGRLTSNEEGTSNHSNEYTGTE